MAFGPKITIDRKTKRMMALVKSGFDGRIESGKKLLMLHVASALIEDIQKAAPDIDGYQYAEDLAVGWFRSGNGGGAAIVFTGESRLIDERRLAGVAIYFTALKSSGPHVAVLERYSPWPGAMVPVKLMRGEALVVSRKISSKETQALTRNVVRDAAKIEKELAAAGLVGVKVKPGTAAAGMEAADDIGFAVLRAEFGLRTEKRPHWRPAIKNLPFQMKEIGSMFAEYVVTGRSRFDKVDPEAVTLNDLAASNWFSRRIS